MIAAPHRYGLARGSDRALAAAAVVVVHVALGLALLSGLVVRIAPRTETITRVVDISLPPPPIRPHPLTRQQPSTARTQAAPRDAAGGSVGPTRNPLEIPTAAILPTATMPAPGGDAGHGPTAGSGNGGGGSGGLGAGQGDGGGTDLELLTGSIDPADYPRAALKAGIGGRVAFRFTVGVNGQVTACTITRSSGNADLDATTCRVVRQRFRYRPSTDAAGRPIADEVDGEHVWSTDARERSD